MPESEGFTLEYVRGEVYASAVGAAQPSVWDRPDPLQIPVSPLSTASVCAVR